MPRCIDADALNAAIEEWFEGVCVYDVSPSEAVNDFQSIVDEQPTISHDEVRGVGEWERVETEFGLRCAKCGKLLDEYVNGGEWVDLVEIPNYCPNCGAKMEVSEDA